MVCKVCLKQKKQIRNEICLVCEQLHSVQEQWLIHETIREAVALAEGHQVEASFLINLVYYSLPYTDLFKIAHPEELEIAICRAFYA